MVRIPLPRLRTPTDSTLITVGTRAFSPQRADTARNKTLRRRGRSVNYRRGTMRLPKLTDAEMNDRQREVSAKIAGRRGQTRGPFLVWLHSPELCERVEALGAYARFESTLELRLRELILLIAARHFDAQYSWNAHIDRCRGRDQPRRWSSSHAGGARLSPPRRAGRLLVLHGGPRRALRQRRDVRRGARAVRPAGCRRHHRDPRQLLDARHLP